MIKVNGHDFPWTEGLTVRELLKQKKYTYPAIIVSVNGVHVHEDEYAKTYIQDRDTVQVLHLIAGG